LAGNQMVVAHIARIYLPATHTWRRHMSKAGEPVAKGGSWSPPP